MKKFVIIALFLPLMFGCSQSPQDKSRSEFDAGVRHLDEFAWDDAMESFTESARSDPASPMGYYGEGLLYEKKLQYLDALNVYMMLVQTQPEFAPGHAGLYRTLFRMGFPDEALLEAVEFVKYAPDSLATTVFWADALISTGAPRRARRELFTTFEGSSIPSEVQIIIASTFLYDREQDSASLYLAHAYADFEPTAAFYRRSADYLELAGLIDSAMVLSRLSINSSGSDFYNIHLHFERCLRTNYFFDARQVIEGFTERGIGDDVRQSMEVAYFLASDEKARAFRASQLLRASHDELVQPVYYEIEVKADMKNGMAVAQETEILLRTLQSREYNLTFQAHIEYLLVLFLSKMDSPLETLERLEKLPAFAARKKEIALARVQLLFDSGQREDAFTRLEELFRLHRTNSDWVLGIGDLHLYNTNRFTEWKKAGEVYRLALDINEFNQVAFRRLIDMYRLVDRTEDALNTFDEYPNFARDYAEFAVMKSQCLVENGDFKAGLKLFKESIPAMKGYRKAYEEILEQLDLADKQTEFLDLIEFCLELNPQNVDMLVLASKAYSEREQFVRAEELAQEAYDLEPENVYCSVQKAVSMYGQNQVEDAIGLLEVIYETNRFVSDISYHLSRMLSLEERDPRKAANLARGSLGMSYMAYHNWMNLCFVYYQGGRFDLARGEAIKASHKFKDSPLPFYWLGMTKYREGNKEASEDFQKAIDLGLRNEELAEARRILAQLSP